jgi:hypothetical protein
MPNWRLPLFGEGINYNVLFDVVIATALTVGSLFNVLPGLLESGGVNPALSSLFSALVLFAPVGANFNELIAPGESVIARPSELPLARSIVDALADAKGPVACEIPAWCFWAKRRIVYDVFSMAERAKRGGNEERALWIRSQAAIMLRLKPSRTSGSRSRRTGRTGTL